MTSSRRAFLASSLHTASLSLLADTQAEARKVVVAADLEPAASAALKAVKAGGNAMDAAAAACLATGMLYTPPVDPRGDATCAGFLLAQTGAGCAVDGVAH